jgi:truncated hemoglobin YjbI
MTETLAEKTCTPCRGGIPPLGRDEALRFQAQAPDWELRDDARRIERTFRFPNFREALAFVQQVGELDEAHHRVSAAGFKYYVTEMVCWATGGPQNYTGRSMSESHKHLKITENEWAAFCKDFDDTMAKFNVPEAEHKELFAIVQSTKGDIVNTSSSL